MNNSENFERNMRLEEAKGLVFSLKSFNLSLEHPIDIDDFRLKLAMLKNSIENGITLSEIGLSEKELSDFEEVPSRYLEK